MQKHMYGTGIARMGSQVLQKELCLTYLVEEAQKVVLICSLDLFELKQQVLPCLAVLGHPETTCIHISVIHTLPSLGLLFILVCLIGAQAPGH